MNILKNMNRTAAGLLIGILAYGALGIICILFFAGNNYSYPVGFLVGIMMSLFYLYHMNSSIEKALMLDEHGAVNKTRKAYGIRLIFTLAVIILCVYTNIGNPVFIVFGMMALKVSAYIQPFTDKFLSKKL